MDPISVLEKAWTVAKKVKKALEKAKENKETCALLVKHIDMIMDTAETLKTKTVDNEKLKKFVDDLDAVLEKALKTAEKIQGDKQSNKNVFEKGFDKLRKAFKAGGFESELQQIERELSLLSERAQYLILGKVYEEEENHIKSAHKVKDGNWELPCEEVCVFCHVTSEGHIVIGGQLPGKDAVWEIAAYSQEGQVQWQWQCEESIGEPSALTQVEVKGKEYIAILPDKQNKIVLFDQRDKSVVPETAWSLTVKHYELRQMVAMDPHRMVVSADPKYGADPSCQCRLEILDCSQLPFCRERTIQLECLDIHSLSPLSSELVVAVCGRTEKVKVYDVKTGDSKWHLDPTQIDGVDVTAQSSCSVDGDVCLYDSTGIRVVMAYDGRWDKEIISKSYIGDSVSALARIPDSKRIVVLHDKNEKTMITLFETKTK